MTRRICEAHSLLSGGYKLERLPRYHINDVVLNTILDDFTLLLLVLWQNIYFVGNRQPAEELNTK